MKPLLTAELMRQLETAFRRGERSLSVSLNLGRSDSEVMLDDSGWLFDGQHYPFAKLKDRTVYYWSGDDYVSISRFNGSLIKLVPTEWGAPTFEIDGIKMLPTAKISPFVDAANKVELIQPRDKVILDCCGGLGYFAMHCLQNGAQQILSFEKNADVLWLRSLNPWSPEGSGSVDTRLSVTLGDVSQHIAALPAASVDAVLHDPPRFGIAGELYSQVFYDHLARVLKRQGRLFHYTGTPNKLTSGRDVPNEVAKRLQQSGFKTSLHGDGVLATKRQ